MAEESKELQHLKSEIAKRKDKVMSYLLSPKYTDLFSSTNLPEDLCCGAVGGDEDVAIPAGGAVEVWHTYTLVHDDIMDRDTLRRGEGTVHTFLAKMAEKKGYSKEEAMHYGNAVGIVAGDIINAWSKLLLSDLHTVKGISSEVTLALIQELEGYVTTTLSAGQGEDIIFEGSPISEVTVDDIVNMLYKKTGCLYEFTARAGAMIGLNTTDREDPRVKALAEVNKTCGIAFQLQDDILGITGDPSVTGKPDDSDIKEGKRTTIVRYSWEAASPEQKARLEELLDKRGDLTDEEVDEVRKLLIELGGVKKTAKLAQDYLSKALGLLDSLDVPDSGKQYVDLLRSFCNYMVNREL